MDSRATHVVPAKYLEFMGFDATLDPTNVSHDRLDPHHCHLVLRGGRTGNSSQCVSSIVHMYIQLTSC